MRAVLVRGVALVISRLKGHSYWGLVQIGVGHRCAKQPSGRTGNGLLQKESVFSRICGSGNRHWSSDSLRLRIRIVHLLGA